MSAYLTKDIFQDMLTFVYPSLSSWEEKIMEPIISVRAPQTFLPRGVIVLPKLNTLRGYEYLTKITIHSKP